MAKVRRMLYDKEYHRQVVELAHKGYTDKEIIKSLSLNPTTLSNWKKEHEELSKDLDLIRRQVARSLEKSLFKLARGYTYVETEEQYIVDADKNIISDKKIRKTRKHCPPDAKALQLILASYDKEKYGEAKNDNAVTINHNFSVPKEISAIVRRIAKKGDDDKG